MNETPRANAPDDEYLWLRVDGRHIVTSAASKGGSQPFIPVGMGYCRDVIIRAQDDAVMRFCKEQGLNTVRLSFYTLFFNGKTDRPVDIVDHIATFIEPVVEAARRHDLYVILDDHEYMSTSIDEGNARGKQTTRPWSEEEIVRWIAAWTAIAERYRDEPRVLGYELLNEPHDMPVDQVRDNYVRCLKAIREVDRRHIIILGNHNWSHARSMEATWGEVAGIVDAPHDNVVFAFHDYPGDDNPWVVEKHVVDFRDKHDVPVMCTEFGATNWSKSETQCREFMAGMHTFLAKEKIGWAVWALKTLQNNPRNSYNLVDQTGLGPPRQYDSCAYSDLWGPAAIITASPMPVRP